MKTILIVEDSLDDIYFLQRALLAAEIRNPLQLVRDGQEAIDYMEGRGNFGDRAAHPFPAVIILDLKLPIVSGLEVLKWIREREVFKGIVISVLSSSRLDSDVALAHRLGCNSYMVKPATVEKLRELVKIHL